MAAAADAAAAGINAALGLLLVGLFWLGLSYCGVRASPGHDGEIPVVCRFAG